MTLIQQLSFSSSIYGSTNEPAPAEAKKKAYNS